MNRTALLAALIAAVLGLVLFFLYMRRYEAEVSGGERVNILVLTRDIALGEAVDRDAIATRAIPQAYYESRHIPQQHREDVIGVRASIPLKANDSLLWTDLAISRQIDDQGLAQLIRSGLRAMSISASNVSFDGLLRPGDRVDVLLTQARPGSNQKVTLPLLQNVLVYAVGGDSGMGNTSSNSRGKNVVLAVTMAQAGLLAHAQLEGIIHLLLRNPDDLEVLADAPETVDSDVMQAAERAKRSRVVRPAAKPQGIQKIESGMDYNEKQTCIVDRALCRGSNASGAGSSG
ncbi:MAG: Flp pilus assembly protein CpaB [Polyangiales bacterium]